VTESLASNHTKNAKSSHISVKIALTYHHSIPGDRMSTTADLITALKKELKAAQMTYADLARALGLAESSVKRMLAKGDLPLSRVDAICRALKLDFAELARRVADAQPMLAEMTLEQERAVVADKKLLLCAICVLSQWTLEQVCAAYRISEAEAIGCFAQLDRIGIIELRALNRYRLKLAKTFRWRPHGPVMDYFRENAVLDYFSGGFDSPGEGLLLVHGSISRALAPSFLERMQKVAQDFAQQHQADQKLPLAQREGYTLLLAMRSWEFEAFAALRR
jgi:DNA-binding Xre family transcriptional regulator